ncbi:GNAT family N-acetyltransferase [Neobacillus drentensis]|uniref:GNAT family N-acetyltransferase n=1 Tax=Neobacillus drentensis TaxID=220684 RepID=UPI00300174D9
MFTKLLPRDAAMAKGSAFISDEVQYNLFHRICEGSDALCLKTEDGKMIFAQTPKQKGWLWISKEVNREERKVLIHELASVLKDVPLPGVASDPLISGEFAEAFSKMNPVRCQIDMTMESYCCPNVIIPKNVAGECRKARHEDIELVADYLAGFLRDAFRSPVDSETQISKAKGMIEAGGLYLWCVDGKPVSMANNSHRSPRHARINAVFTPIEQRKNGYASSIVAALCTNLEKEQLVPMLYADISNPDSNKVYQNIGFLKSGKITEINFLR